MDIKQIGVYAVMALLAIGLVFALVANSNKFSEEDVKSIVSPLQTSVNTLTDEVSVLKTSNNALIGELDTLETDIESKDAKIAELELADEETTASEERVSGGYDKELEGIVSFDLGELNDNQVEKLADYTIVFDGDDIDVNEYLTVKGDFNLEGDVSLNFEDGDVVYRIEFESGLDFKEDTLNLNVMGEDLEIIADDVDEMSIKRASKTILKAGETLNGLEVLKIGENTIVVKVGDVTEIINEEDDAEKVNGLKVDIEAIFYSNIVGESLVIIRVGKDLDEKIEVDDYVDEDELWQYTLINISDGIIEITLTDDVDEVSELVMPNDFATISFSLSTEDYNDVKIVKDDDLLSEVEADFENFDATEVEFKDGNWIIEGNNGNDVDVSRDSLLLKDSDYAIDFGIEAVRVFVADIKVRFNIINGNIGDEDVKYTTSNGIVIPDRDSWNEDDDESITLSVPEEAITATIYVQ